MRLSSLRRCPIHACICLVPIIHILSMSLSSSTAVSAGRVSLLPVEFTLKSYEYVLKKPEFWRAFGVSIERVILGVGTNMIMVILAAYPLSKTPKEFGAKNFFVWFFMITMLFSGGMIPTFMVVRLTGIQNTIWSLILPGAVPVFNVVLHWNSWFDGMLYMSDAANYPMQTYLQSILVSTNVKLMTKAQAELLRLISDRTLKAAQIFIASVPIMMVYPFLQKYFVAGMTMGSVKE